MLRKKRLKAARYGDIDVYYLPHLDGGGTSFGQDFVPIVEEHFKNVGRVCEFCSGPGFIGFSLLAHGLCDSLCLVDINKDAIEACKYTIRESGLSNRVAAYVSNGLKNVPKSEKWDLVVSNPPHFSGTEKEYGMDVIAIDPGWRIHREFYKNISRFLKPGGSVVFVENEVGSNPRQWRKMIEENGLRQVKSFRYNGIKRSDTSILRVFSDRVIESVQDGTIFSKGSKFYLHNFKKFVRGTYRQDKFYYVWSKKGGREAASGKMRHNMPVGHVAGFCEGSYS